MSKPKSTPQERLKHHVTGAIERGEKQAIGAVLPKPKDTPLKVSIDQAHFAQTGEILICKDAGGEGNGELMATVHGNLSFARLITAGPEMRAALELILDDDRLMNAMSKEQAKAIMYSVSKARGSQ